MQFLQLHAFFLLVICIAIQICNAYSHSHVNKYIKSANIIPSKYIFYGNIEDLQQYKTVYHTLLIRIKFKGNVNISHSSMVEVFDDEFINEDGAKFKKVTTSNKHEQFRNNYHRYVYRLSLSSTQLYHMLFISLCILVLLHQFIVMNVI